MAASTRSARARAGASMLFQKPTSRSSWLLVRRSRLLLMSITLLLDRNRQCGLPRLVRRRQVVINPRLEHPPHEVGHPLRMVTVAGPVRDATRAVFDLGQLGPHAG